MTLWQRLQRFPIGRFIRFGIVGFSGLFVDTVVFVLLLEGVGLQWVLSSALSIEAAIINNFLWNDAWTFADVAQQQRGWKARFQRFYQFNSVCLIGAALQLGLTKMLLWVPWVDQLPEFLSQFVSGDQADNADKYFAKVVAIVIVTFWNFWVNLKLSWRKK